MLDAPRETRANLGLLLIVAVYFVVATLYAVRTPIWQNPDEPAHFNYIRTIWETKQLPVLQMGDYPHDYLQEIVADKFPADMSIDPIRYESHQPPLYYALAAPIYGLVQGWPLNAQVLTLRLLSVFFGACLLAVSYLLFRLVFPENAWLALLACGFAAAIPMNVAVSAAVNNDPLANLLLASTMLLILWAVRRAQQGKSDAWRQWLLGGVVLGLAMLTKTTTYAAIPVGVVALIWQWRQRTLSFRSLAAQAGAFFGPALALNVPWYVRNALVYGGTDILGLARHNAIVLGQPTTADWLAQMGWGGLAKAFVGTTFRSFWGQFGWMGVLVDERIYQGLGLLSALLFLGFLLFLLRASVNRYLLSRYQWMALALLGVWFASTAVLYLWYNLQFVQHQGRYLFPALPAIALAMALGFQESLRPTRARAFTVLAVLGIAASLGLILTTGRSLKTATLLLALTALAYVVVGRLGPRRDWVWQASIYVAFAGLDLLCLFGFIVPYLGG
jgi:4-amino-4-deoxy-L-arabinose transferase-like glycosyltransferase